MTASTETLLDGVSGFPMVDAEVTRPSTRAWGETALSRSSEKRLMVFAGTSNQDLAKGIAQRLGITDRIANDGPQSQSVGARLNKPGAMCCILHAVGEYQGLLLSCVQTTSAEEG